MAKRYLESSLWDKSWFRKLHPKLKLFYYYMISKCNHAGVWADVDIELAEFQIGMPIDEAEILKELKDHIEVIKPKKWYIHKFVKFQYGELNPNVRAHASVIKILNENNLNVNKGLDKALKQSQTVKDKDKYKDKDLVKDNKVKDNKEIDMQIKKMLDNGDEFLGIIDCEPNKKALGYRYVKFCNEISKYAEEFDKDDRVAFRVYWTELNRSKTKMKFELQKTWVTKLRLNSWVNNDFNSKKVNKSFKLDSTGNAFIAYCKKCGESDFYNKFEVKNDSRCCKSELLPEHPKKGMLK